MKIKKGDKVIVISGKDKGTEGVVEKAFPSEGSVVIAGVNVKKLHRKNSDSKGKGNAKKIGQIIERPAPISVSNVQLIDPKTKKGTRIGIIIKDGQRVRVAKKSGSELQ